MNLHKLYAGVIAGVITISGIAAVSWTQHVRDDAKRDAVIDAQKSDISQLEKKIADAQSQAQAQIAALEQQKQQVKASPSTAPVIIREVLPTAATEPRSPEAAKQNLPDAPTPKQAMMLSQQDQQDLAQYILSCKQCAVEHDQLQSQVSDQQQVIDKQKTELAAAMKAAKGGSVWQRTKRALKWGAVFGAIGYVAGRAQR